MGNCEGLQTDILCLHTCISASSCKCATTHMHSVGTIFDPSGHTWYTSPSTMQCVFRHTVAHRCVTPEPRSAVVPCNLRDHLLLDAWPVLALSCHSLGCTGSKNPALPTFLSHILFMRSALACQRSPHISMVHCFLSWVTATPTHTSFPWAWQPTWCTYWF